MGIKKYVQKLTQKMIIKNILLYNIFYVNLQLQNV